MHAVRRFFVLYSLVYTYLHEAVQVSDHLLCSGHHGFAMPGDVVGNVAGEALTLDGFGNDARGAILRGSSFNEGRSQFLLQKCSGITRCQKSVLKATYRTGSEYRHSRRYFVFKFA